MIAAVAVYWVRVFIITAFYPRYPHSPMVARRAVVASGLAPYATRTGCELEGRSGLAKHPELA